MSVFVKVSRFAAEPRFYRIRSFCCTLGQDREGIFTVDQPHKNFFEICAFGDRYLVHPLTEGFVIDGQPWCLGDVRWIDQNLLIEGFDYSIMLCGASSIAELAALRGVVTDLVSATVKPELLPLLSYKLAGYSRSFRLLPELKLSIGSSESDSIYIDLKDVRPRHLELCYSQAEVVVVPVSGEISIDGITLLKPLSLYSDSTVVIEPVGLRLQLHFGEKNSD